MNKIKLSGAIYPFPLQLRMFFGSKRASTVVILSLLILSIFFILSTSDNKLLTTANANLASPLDETLNYLNENLSANELLEKTKSSINEATDKISNIISPGKSDSNAGSASSNENSDSNPDLIDNEIVKDLPFRDYVEEYHVDDLRSRLNERFPYDRNNSQIPKIIWQTWKDSVISDNIDDPKLKKSTESWIQQDDYTYNIVNDQEIEDILTDEYINFPEILKTYHLLPKNILRFDLARYLLLYARGGLYTDIDTTNILELSKWVDNPDRFNRFLASTSSADAQIDGRYPKLNTDMNILNHTEVGFVVGIESDYDSKDWHQKTCRRLQFCQWSIKSKPGHPILRELINAIVTITLKNYNPRLNHVKIGDEYHTLHSIYTVLEWTGPGIFTDSIFNHLNKLYQTNDEIKYWNVNSKTLNLKNYEFDEDAPHRDKNFVNLDDKDKNFGWLNFTRISKPVVFDDVVILPINSFNGFIEDLEYPIDNQYTYSKHGFRGLWKSMT